MKRRDTCLTVALPVMVILMIALPAWAKTERAHFLGKVYFCPPLSPPTCLEAADGTEICRGLGVLFKPNSDCDSEQPEWEGDERFLGDDAVVINYNFRGGTGPQWGTFHLTNDDGYWDGTWTGFKMEDGDTYLKGVGHGADGYEGLKVFWTGERLSPYLTDPIVMEGYIFDPNSD
jgi:hypothetical protein